MKQIFTRLCFLSLAAGLPVFGQYGGFGGPSILSRGASPTGRTGSNPVSFNFFAGAIGSYSTNLNRFMGGGQDASLSLRDTFGMSGVAGVQGYKSTARSSTSLDLGVNYYRTRTRQVSQGLSESLSVTHSRQVSRRVTWYIGAQGQSTNRAVSFANSRYSPEPLAELTPQQDEIFDTRTYRANLGTGVTFQKSARLSFAAQAGAFGNERRSKRLADSRGIMGNGSVQYSLNRRQYVGASFTYGTFYFPGSYGETSYYTPQGFYGIALSKAWNFTVYGGLYNARTDRLMRVQLDPFIAQLTGQTSMLEIYKGVNQGFSGGAGLYGEYRRWGMSLVAQRGIMPGNGIYLTSEMTAVTAMASHTMGRSATWSLMGRAAETKALTQTMGNARLYSGGATFTYRLTDYLNFNSNLTLYKTQAAGNNIKFGRFMASAGIYFSPGEMPAHIF